MRTPNTNRGTSRTTGGTTISATSTPSTVSRPRNDQRANPQPASAATSRVKATDAPESSTVLPSQRGNWSPSAVRKPASVGSATGAQGCARKLDCVLNAAEIIT